VKGIFGDGRVNCTDRGLCVLLALPRPAGLLWSLFFFFFFGLLLPLSGSEAVEVWSFRVCRAEEGGGWFTWNIEGLQPCALAMCKVGRALMQQSELGHMTC